MAINNLLLVTDKGNVLRARLKLDLFQNIKAVTLSDLRRKKEARYEPYLYAKKPADFLGANVAHISQGLDGNPIFSSYNTRERIIELYAQK